MRLKSGEEKFEIAIQGKKIIYSTIEEIKEVLRLVMLKLGLRGQNLPSNEEKLVLITHIIENYGGRHTCEEIALAFDLAIAGQLDVEVKAYENFSCLYFSSIMNAYRQWSTYPFLQYEQKRKHKELPYDQREFELTEEEMELWIKEWDAEKLESIKSIHFVPVMFYAWLTDKELLQLSTDQKNEYLKKAISFKLQEYSELPIRDNRFMKKIMEDFKNEVKLNEFSEGNHRQLKVLAKKIAVFDYIKNIKNDLPKV